jgi:putative holliday junction resolvase
VRPGVRLAVDVGKVRVGVARSDGAGMMAVPVATVPRTSALSDIEQFVGEHNPTEIVVGLPLNLAGQYTASTDDAVAFAHELRDRVDLPIRMVDERLSTVSAASALHRGGTSSRKQRSVVDQVAAVILLQHTLDTEQSQGVPAGFLLQDLPRYDQRR